MSAPSFALTVQAGRQRLLQCNLHPALPPVLEGQRLLGGEGRLNASTMLLLCSAVGHLGTLQTLAQERRPHCSSQGAAHFKACQPPRCLHDARRCRRASPNCRPPSPCCQCSVCVCIGECGQRKQHLCSAGEARPATSNRKTQNVRCRCSRQPSCRRSTLGCMACSCASSEARWLWQHACVGSTSKVGRPPDLQSPLCQALTARRRRRRQHNPQHCLAAPAPCPNSPTHAAGSDLRWRRQASAHSTHNSRRRGKPGSEWRPGALRSLLLVPHIA